MMSMTMYNGLNCPIPKNITMYSKNDENPRLSEISFDFSNVTIEHIEHLNAGPEVVFFPKFLYVITKFLLHKICNFILECKMGCREY